MRLATGRRRYGVVPIDPGIVAEQQRMAEAFLALGLIPHAIRVQAAVAAAVLV